MGVELEVVTGSINGRGVRSRSLQGPLMAAELVLITGSINGSGVTHYIIH